jgi:mono/diheme cytochrome c family protein
MSARALLSSILMSVGLFAAAPLSAQVSAPNKSGIPLSNFDPFGNYGDYYGKDYPGESVTMGVGHTREGQSVDVGQYEYEANCAICHGSNGTGPDRDPYWNLLATPIPNIAVLAKRNGGAFPFKYVYRLIDGREETRAHGSRDMPVWGEVFKQGGASLNPNYDPEGFAQAKILAIAEYVYHLQQK